MPSLHVDGRPCGYGMRLARVAGKGGALMWELEALFHLEVGLFCITCVLYLGELFVCGSDVFVGA